MLALRHFFIRIVIFAILLMPMVAFVVGLGWIVISIFGIEANFGRFLLQTYASVLFLTILSVIVQEVSCVVRLTTYAKGQGLKFSDVETGWWLHDFRSGGKAMFGWSAEEFKERFEGNRQKETIGAILSDRVL